MLVDLLKDLVSIDSSTKDGANKAVEYCSGWLTDHGLTVNLIKNNGYKMLVCEIGKGDKTLIFNGHVDIVSGKPDQFIPVIEEGKLYGRGAADMKAGVAAMMCAMTELQGQELGLKIQLQIVSDEETGGFNCSGYLVKQGYLGDFVICAEPTQLGIGLQAKGILQADIEISGIPAHGSRPWEGINAIEKAYDVFQKVRNLPFTHEKSEFYASPSLNLAKIRAGEVYNKVPDKCLLSFDIRYLPTQDKDEIIQQIENVTNGKLIAKRFSLPVKTKLKDPYITLLRPVIEKHTNQDAVIFGQHGSADTVYYAALDIPAIEFGPSGENWHGDREYVVLESVSVYQNMLIDFAHEFVKTNSIR
ncbi:M20 family peptidase [Peribacillus cavernae]|uniref:M20 family peptidase n=1 Tax=Peribacillus cavernae TaxID=1674310 RepID=A0A3S0VBA7_9BACI|nr:M20/M25/M40 family metallo-hydrolase [Peribacillus cavernae]MDQ0219103.1 succinyl-diaminopimelate desuccinylase [Peribacillus cavernae]RUQ28664.1 M20 family peptidase [Peribacillus cavernae]